MLALSLILSLTALAKDVGVDVTWTVTAEDGSPIPTARVFNPQERDRHSVNTETGRFGASQWYLPDGSEVLFDKGMTVEVDAIAPGYNRTHATYVVGKKAKNNQVPVTLLAAKPFAEADCLKLEGLPELTDRDAMKAWAEAPEQAGEEAQRCVWAARAIGGHLEASRALASHVTAMDEASQDKLREAERRASTLAREWGDWAAAAEQPTGSARQICWWWSTNPYENCAF